MTASPDQIPEHLLSWYRAHARDLPWRAQPGQAAPDPYRVWLSEVMLQQTTVAAVKPYFAKFTERWPDIFALAAASEADVMAAWAGLGYYSRARNLVKCARIVADLGGFPETEERLRQLPGLGAYTAAAIAAIAFGQKAVVVDANVERVVSRLYAIAQPLPGSRATIRKRASEITPDRNSGDFAQAMMDLGSSICTSRDARCLVCPLSSLCQARQIGDPLAFPVKAPKKEKPVRNGTAFWIERGGYVWLETRQGTGMLGGMRALPDDGWSARENGTATPPFVSEWQDVGVIRHTFTHAHLELQVQTTRLGPDISFEAGEWWLIEELDDAGLPTLFAKAAQLVLAQA